MLPSRLFLILTICFDCFWGCATKHSSAKHLYTNAMKVARVMTDLCDPEVFSSIQFLEGQLAAICTKFKNVRGWHQTSEFNVGGYKSSSRMGSHAKLFETTPVWCLPSPLLHTNSCCPDLFHMTFGRTERFWSLPCFRADPGLTWAGMARVQNDFLWLPVLVNFSSPHSFMS